jgi:glycosyltransferase involved in cell wall biosynthesis
MINADNTLVCLFSYNMTDELEILIRSIRKHLSGFSIMVIDDGSTIVRTRDIIHENEDLFSSVILQELGEKKGTRGRLADNIQFAYETSLAKGYEYLFLIQDDMQFVRAINEDILHEYSRYFSDERVVEVDPRFLRRMGEIHIDKEMGCYHFDWSDDRSSYADVGILKISRLAEVGWSFGDSERFNKVQGHKLGFRRVFPYRPSVMHLPYPVIYRKGKRRNKFPSPFVRRGGVYYEDISQKQISVFDCRPMEEIPYARDFLKPRNLGLAALHYRYAHEGRVFA